MRDPVWNQGKRACTLTMHSKEAEKVGLMDGQMVRVTTEAGAEVIELEVTARLRRAIEEAPLRGSRTDMARISQVVIPYGFGLVYQGKVFGVNVNRLTKNTHRDPITGTPLHRYVRCRVEAA